MRPKTSSSCCPSVPFRTARTSTNLNTLHPFATKSSGDRSNRTAFRTPARPREHPRPPRGTAGPTRPAGGINDTAPRVATAFGRITTTSFNRFYQPICRLCGTSANVLSRTGKAHRGHREANADVAQLVAHHLAKVRVAGSNPVIRSRGRARRLIAFPPCAVEWPSGEATACKAVHTGSIPVSTSRD